MADLRYMHRMIIHPFFSVSIPCTFIISMLLVLNSMISPGKPLPATLFLIIVLTGIEEVSVGNALVQERASSLARLREIIIVIGLCIAGMLLVPEDRQDVFWGFKTFLVAVIVFFQWLLSFIVQNNFRRRESILGVIGKKDGEELKDTIRNAGIFAGEIRRSLLYNRSMFTGFIFMETLLVLGLFWFGSSASFLTQFFITLSLATSLTGIALINMYVSDLYIYSAGINIKPFLQKRRICTVIIWVVLIAVLSVFLSSDRTFLSLTWLFDFLERIIPEKRSIDPRLLPPVPPRNDALIRELRELQYTEPLIDLSWLLLLFEKLVFIGFVSGLVLFLFTPLARGEGIAFFRKYNPVRIFLRLCVMLWTYVEQFWRDLLKGFRPPDRQVDRRETVRKGIPVSDDRPGMLKRVERNTVLKLFLKILKWGKKQNMPYKGHAPSEYTDMLAKKYPELGNDFVCVAEMFEEAMFSRHLVGECRLRIYRDAVRRIISY